ncbi:MAG TPA: TolC family protein [Terriglobales bacterium]|nr:TolC family protein [Terriglobales bacterium]
MRFIALAIAGMTCTLVAGESTTGYRHKLMTLDDAVDLALKQNPSILGQIQTLKIQKGAVYVAQSPLLPHVTASAQINKTDPGLIPRVSRSTSAFDLLAVRSGQPLIISPNGTTNAVAVPFSSFSSGGASTALDTWQVQLTLSQLIWDGGASIAARRQARIAEDAAYYTLRDTIDQVVSTVRTQFYTILEDKALIQVQEESVNLLESQLADQKSRFEAGTVPQFNVLQAQSQLENQRPLLIQAINNYRIAQINLAKTLGIPADRQYTTEEPLPVAGQLGFSPIKYDLSSALITARANRPFLKAQRSSILEQVENITVQAAGFQPTFSADVGLEQRSNPTSNNLRNTLQGWFMGLTGSWNVFDGLSTYGRVKEARAQLEQAKVTYDDSVRQVELEVSTAVSNLRQSEQTVASAKVAVQFNLEALRLANERLAAGTGTQLDVLNAQTQLTTARSNLVVGEFSYISAVSDFQRATATETKYNDTFDDPLGRPRTLTTNEAKKASRARVDSPLDPNKPATAKAKRESLIPPQGKVSTPER